jgi:A/G-specific adenine glycosylase
VAAVIVNDGKVLLARRPSAGLLGGMWEFPNAAVSADLAAGLAPALEAAYGLKVRPGPPLDVVRHVYTHFRLVEHVFASELETPFIPSICAWVPVGALGEYPMGKVDRQISATLRDEWCH